MVVHAPEPLLICFKTLILTGLVVYIFNLHSQGNVYALEAGLDYIASFRPFRAT